jgi:hypothetical protein
MKNKKQRTSDVVDAILEISHRSKRESLSAVDVFSVFYKHIGYNIMHARFSGVRHGMARKMERVETEKENGRSK